MSAGTRPEGAFRQSISFELQHSVKLNVLPDGRVEEVLSEMPRTSGARLTPEIAGEICQRSATAAFVETSLFSGRLRVNAPRGPAGRRTIGGGPQGPHPQ